MNIRRENSEIPIKDIKPFAKNARTHSAEQVAQIAASIREFGFTNPVLVDEHMNLIAGHGRVAAAEGLGMTHVPAVVLTGLTEPQRRALVLADNKLGLNAGWDMDLLGAELKELDALGGIDLSITGFSGNELDKLLGLNVAASGEDDTPESAPAVTVPGDIWQLGPHRVACGDSTSATAVADLLAGGTPHLMVTDPPYGVEYDPAWRDIKHSDKVKRRTGTVQNDDRADWREAWALFPGNIAYIWHGGAHAHTVADSLIACGYKLRAQIVWVKQNFAISRGDYHWMHEPCWYAVKGTGRWTGDRKQTTVWEIDNLNHASAQESQNSRTNHSTQKPVECMRRPILNNSAEGDIVYDPFLGSGTTLIAAESTGRVCYGMELSPQYCDIIVKRWEEFTGKKAVLQQREKVA